MVIFPTPRAHKSLQIIFCFLGFQAGVLHDTHSFQTQEAHKSLQRGIFDVEGFRLACCTTLKANISLFNKRVFNKS